MKTVFSCGFSIDNWQKIEKAGGKVIKAGSIWIEYLAVSKIV